MEFFKGFLWASLITIVLFIVGLIAFILLPFIYVMGIGVLAFLVIVIVLTDERS